MAHYIINATPGHASADFVGNWQEEQHNGNFFLRNSNVQPGLRVGDEFVSFVADPNSTYNSEIIVMANKGIFKRVATFGDLPTNKELAKNDARVSKGLQPLKYYKHEITFEGAYPFTKYKYLDDYTYSLQKIYKRYIKPVRHFSHSITSINLGDFETLVKERIFIERTIFGKLINSIPYTNRLEFLLYAIEKFGNADLREISPIEALPDLKKIVRSGVIELGKYMVESQKLVEEMESIFGSNANVGFANNLTTDINKDPIVIDSLKMQANLFNAVFSINHDFDSLFSSQNFELSKDDRDYFKSAFSKRFWPVDLTPDEL